MILNENLFEDIEDLEEGKVWDAVKDAVKSGAKEVGNAIKDNKREKRFNKMFPVFDDSIARRKKIYSIVYKDLVDNLKKALKDGRIDKNDYNRRLNGAKKYYGNIKDDSQWQTFKNNHLSYKDSKFRHLFFESLEEDEIPYTKDQVDKELKSITSNWTRKDGTIKVYYNEELKHVKDLLSDHYEYVETSRGPQGWKIVAYTTPKKED